MIKKTELVSLMLLAGAAVVPAVASAETVPDRTSVNVTLQDGKVTCTVEDDFGPVTGASVIVKGTTNGNVTDMEGKVVLEGVKNGDIIQVSFIGYATQEIPYTGQAVISITLREDTQSLDEVVVVAYGTSRKGDVTGALTTIKPDGGDIAMPSINSLLEGKVAGLVASTASSVVGSASSVVIRGANSLRGDNQPLYVIDNIPQASTGEFSGSAISGEYQIEQDPLSQLNPADIVDITILKDASSTAIYGSRGANGVILITTKKGEEGAARINASAVFTIAEPTNLLSMMKLADYADYQNSKQSNALVRQFHRVGDEIRYVFNNATGQYNPGDPSTYHLIRNRDWQDEIYTTAFSQNYSLSVNGGTDKITYYLSANFKDVDGTVKQTSLQQGDLRANLSAQLSKRVKLELMLNGSIRKNDMMAGGNSRGGATGAISRTALNYAPFEMPAGDPSFSDENRTTVFSWLNDYVDKAENRSFGASLNLVWEISDHFRYNLRTGGNLTTNDRKRWFGLQLFKGMNDQGSLSIDNLDRNNYSVENLLMYNGKIGETIKIDATAGVTYEDYNYLNETTLGKNFTFFELREKGLSKAGTVEHTQPLQKDYQLFSYLTRLNVSLYDKYLLTASLRADGSSKFASGNRWGYFPSASLAWRMEQEEYFRNLEWLNQLKVRLSYGVTGNQSIDPYSTFSLYGQNSGGDVVYAGPDGSQLTTFVVTNLANNSLKWEQTSSWNVGIDFGFFRSRLTGTLDLYKKKTKDLLILRQLPGSAGFPSTYYNQGSLDNKGVEFSLSGQIIDKKDVKWSVTGNIGVNRGKIDDLGIEPTDFGVLKNIAGYYGNSIGDHFGEANVFLTGKAPGLFFGYRTQGIIQTEDVTDQGIRYTRDDGTTGYYTSFMGNEAKAGDVKFVDTNNDGVVNASDRTIIGDPNPSLTYGFSTKVSYRQFSLSASFYGVAGIDRFNTNTRYIGTVSQANSNILNSAYRDMWTAENHSNKQPSSAFVIGNYSMDRYIEDASYLRCSDITLNYTLPVNWMKKIGFQGCALSFSVKNAFVITDYSGYDPEVNSFAFDGLRPGIDMSSYPTPRSYIIGVNLTL